MLRGLNLKNVSGQTQKKRCLRPFQLLSPHHHVESPYKFPFHVRESDISIKIWIDSHLRSWNTLKPLCPQGFQTITLWLLNIAMENGPSKWMVYLLKMVIFHGELLVITRGYLPLFSSSPPSRWPAPDSSSLGRCRARCLWCAASWGAEPGNHEAGKC